MPKFSALLRTCFAVMLAAAVLLVAAFNRSKPRPDPKAAIPAAAPQPQPTAKKITAGEVKFSRETPNKRFVKGSFKVTEGGQGAIPSYGTGGACLIADLNKFNMPPRVNGQRRTCSQLSDCQDGLPSGGFGYCADAADGTAEKICWIRPGPDTLLCDKSIFHNPPTVWPLGVDHQLTPVDVSASDLLPQLSGPVRWRVVACLNGKDLVPNPDPGPGEPAVVAACGGGDLAPPLRLEVFGPVSESHWPPN